MKQAQTRLQNPILKFCFSSNVVKFQHPTFPENQRSLLLSHLYILVSEKQNGVNIYSARHPLENHLNSFSLISPNFQVNSVTRASPLHRTCKQLPGTYFNVHLSVMEEVPTSHMRRLHCTSHQPLLTKLLLYAPRAAPLPCIRKEPRNSVNISE